MKGINNKQRKQLQLKAITMFSAVLLLSACGAKKQLVKDNSTAVTVNNNHNYKPSSKEKRTAKHCLSLPLYRKLPTQRCLVTT